MTNATPDPIPDDLVRGVANEMMEAVGNLGIVAALIRVLPEAFNTPKSRRNQVIRLRVVPSLLDEVKWEMIPYVSRDEIEKIYRDTHIVAVMNLYPALDSLSDSDSKQEIFAEFLTNLFSDTAPFATIIAGEYIRRQT